MIINQIDKLLNKRFIFKIENFFRIKNYDICQFDRIFVHEFHLEQKRVFIMIILMNEKKQKTNSNFRIFLLHLSNTQLIMKLSNVLTQNV